MKVLIIEDETPAAEKLEHYLLKEDSSTEVAAKIKTVKKSIIYLTEHLQELDLIFMDIQLLDGLSFEIFDQLQVDKPVIFTTAFDEYAINAFKANSVAYLLKPITFTDLSAAMSKLDRIRAQFTRADNVNELVNKITKQKYKERFLVRVGEHIKSIKIEDVALFYADGRHAYLVTNEKRKFIIDYKLEALVDMLDPKFFFRTNRTYIVNINGIKDVLVYSNSRLKITPVVDFDQEILVSREKVTVFKEWLSGE